MQAMGSQIRRLGAALLLVCGGLLALPAQAEVFKAEADLLPFTEGFMKQVAAGDLKGAYASAKPYSTLATEDLDKALQQAQSARTVEFVQRYGRTRGHEFVSKRKVGISLARIVFLEKTDKHPIMWSFFFYQSPTGWVLDSFTWDNQVAAAFLRH